MKQLRDERQRFRAVVAILDDDVQPIGSGFFVGEEGLILTAAHVIDENGEPPAEVWVRVYTGERETEQSLQPAEVVRGYFFAEKSTDLAVLRLREPPAGALWLAPGASSRCRRAVGFGYPEQCGEGLGLEASVHTLMPGPWLQLTCEQITHGYSGGPLIDGQSGAVIAVVNTIFEPDPDPATRKWDNECFAVPIERVAATLAEAFVHGEEDDEAGELVVAWIDQVSREVGPRSTWRVDPAVHGSSPALAEADVAVLARLFAEVEEGFVGEVLWRLSKGVLKQVRAEMRAGRDWRAATFDSCRTSGSLLRLLVAALCETRAPGCDVFDREVHRILQLRYSEQALRDHAEALGAISFAWLLELASKSGCVDVQTLKMIPESRNQALCVVRWLASRSDGVLARVLQVAGQWGDGVEPVAEVVASITGCSLVVAVELTTGGNIRAGFWGIPHGAGEQRNLGVWVGASLEDQGMRDALHAAERQLRSVYDVATEQVSVEFALPRELFAEAVEGWLFKRTQRIHEKLGAMYPVVLRSTDRLYDADLQRLWADWEKKWDAFLRTPVLHWLQDPAEALALRKADGVGLKFMHTPDPQDDADPVMLCIDNMVPVALWWRPSGAGAVDPEPEALPVLPAWVLARRRAAEGADDSVVLMWDDPRRIPSNARQQRENLARRTVA